MGYKEHLMLLVIYTFITCANISFTQAKYPVINEKCNVYFNYTKEHEETKHIFLNQLRRYENCWDGILKSTMGRNLTSIEEKDCHSKCAQIAEGSVFDDGSFNNGFLDSVEREYLRYSNASSSFIDKITSALSTCAIEVAVISKSLQTSDKVNPSECRVNGLFHNCWLNSFWTRVDNATVEDLCGDIKGTKPEKVTNA